MFIAANHKSSSNSYYPNFIICTISGRTITSGTSLSQTGLVRNLIKLDEERVFVDYLYYNSDNVKIYSINDTTITANDDGYASSVAENPVTTKIAENKILLIWGTYLSTTYYLYSRVCTISGTTITAGTTNTIKTSTTDSKMNAYYMSRASSQLIDKNKIFIAFCVGSAYSLYYMICTFDDNGIITIDIEELLTNGSYDGYNMTTTFNENEIFIAHSNGGNNIGYLNSIIYQLKKGIKTVSSSNDEILGIANENGTGGDTIEVYVPRTNLFNKDTATLDYRLAPQGQEYADSNCFVSDWIEIKPNTTYIKNIPADVYQCVCFFEEDKTFISRDKDNTTFTSPSNAKYLRMTGYKTDLNTTTLFQK